MKCNRGHSPLSQGDVGANPTALSDASLTGMIMWSSSTVMLRSSQPLRVGSSTISMVFHRDEEMTAFSLIDRKGDLRVVMEE